jgi:hypothetical protein
MKHWLSLIFIPLLIACSGGEGTDAQDTPAASVSETSLPILADQMIDDGKTLGEMLTRVESTETAEQIRPAIEDMIEEYRVLFAKMETMESPTFSDMAAMASRAPRLVETQERIASEIQRIYNDHPEAADVLRDALDDFGQQ